MSLNWDLSDVFLMIGFGFMGFGEEDHRGQCPFHYIGARMCPVNMTWCWPWSLGWGSVCRVLQRKAFSVFPCCPLWKEESWSTAHTYGVGSYTSHPWGWSDCISYVEFSCTRDSTLLPILIIFFSSYLCHRGLLDIYLIVYTVMEAKNVTNSQLRFCYLISTLKQKGR